MGRGAGGGGRSGGGSGAEKVNSLSGDSSFYGADSETAYIFSKNGKLIAKVSGDGSTVDLSSVSAKDTQNALFTHNHPSKDLASDTWTFSSEDIGPDGNFSSITATGKYKTYTMTRPPKGWGNHEADMAATQRKLKFSDKYVQDFLKYRDRAFGDSYETLNRDARKFWKTYSEISGASYTETKRKK